MVQFDTECCAAGLVNEKTLHIEAGEENISVTRSHPKHANRPAQHKAKANKKGKNFRNTSRKLSKDVSSYRPDLKVAKPARTCFTRLLIPCHLCPGGRGGAMHCTWSFLLNHRH